MTLQERLLKLPPFTLFKKALSSNLLVRLREVHKVMGKSVAVLQSNYIPWKGYFDLINSVDEFILFDDMQYTRRDWRNRNRIKTSKGSEWITIPVCVKGRYHQKINETVVTSDQWSAEHWKKLLHNYSKARCFSQLAPTIKELYTKSSTIKLLSEINYLFIEFVCRFLKISTRLTRSSDYKLVEGKNERLINLCLQSDASRYLSGPSARDYMNVEMFESAGIEVNFFDYSGYPEYQQRFPPFEHGVSILDLLFNEGEQAYHFMKSF